MASPLPTSPTTRRTLARLATATREEIEATGSFTADRVAHRAGTSPATFYAYFPSKSDALSAAFEGVLNDLVAFCESAFSIERLVEQGLARFCQSLTQETIRFFQNNERVFRLALAALPEHRGMRAHYRACEKETLEHQERWVGLAQRAGLVRDGKPSDLARGLLVLLQGINNPSVLRTRNKDHLRAELARALFSFLDA